MNLLKLKISLMVLLFSAISQAQTLQHLQTDTTETNTELAKNFQNPLAKPQLTCYWWWLNGMATKASITRDLEQMKAKGYDGASLVDAGSSNYQVAKKTAMDQTL